MAISETAANAANSGPTIKSLNEGRDACMKVLDDKLAAFGKKKANGDPDPNLDAAIADLFAQRTSLAAVVAGQVMETQELKDALVTLEAMAKDLEKTAAEMPTATAYMTKVTAFTEKVTKAGTFVKDTFERLKAQEKAGAAAKAKK